MEFGSKKVEYIELIYDLVFVYFLGRSNELLHHTEGGFITASTYLAYFLSTLVILQIWYHSTLFINRYGDNSIRNTVGLFINMYLIYFMANSTRADWHDYYIRYNVAWGLILLNIAVQYYLMFCRTKKNQPWLLPHLKRNILLLVIQAVLIFITIPLYDVLPIPLTWVPLVAGFIFSIATRNIDALLPVNFEHLTERVMLFVVFTFGEMIVSIAIYFDGAFTLNTFYFSLMALLIVAGLFLSYGFLYNNIIDRNRVTTGASYMLLHILLLVALCNITAALVFMTDSGINSMAKNIFLVASFLIYFVFLIILGSFSKECERLQKRTILLLIILQIAFIVVMGFFYSNSYITIAASVLYIFGIHFLLVANHRKVCSENHDLQHG